MKRIAGFTLVELIVATVIIAVSSVCSLEFFRFCQKCFISTSESKLMAANYARETMEERYWLPSSALVDGNFTDSLPAGSKLSATRTYSISTNNTNGYKVIKVSITY